MRVRWTTDAVDDLERICDYIAENSWHMTDQEFWTDLEYRVCRELRGLADNRLRFLWCDGFVPDDHQPDTGIVAGRA